MDYRVTQEFTLTGDPPDQAGTDRLRDRLRNAVPGSGAVVELGLGRMRVVMTIDAVSAQDALEMARAGTTSVMRSGPAYTDVEPAEPV